MNLTTLFSELALLLSLLNGQLDILKDKEIKADVNNFIMECESGKKFNPFAINWDDAKITGYPSKGLYQFQPLTFLNAGLKYKVLPKETKLKDIDKYIFRPEYNAAVAHALLENGEYGHWQNCYKKYLSPAGLKR